MKHTLITGGTGGIGRHLTKSFLELGHHVTVWGRNKEDFDTLAESLQGISERLTFHKVDISNGHEVETAAAEVSELDVLINAAAVMWPVKMFLDTSMDKLEASIGITLLGTINSCYYLLPLLKKKERGKIINFGGGGAGDGRISHMAYSVAKTGVVRFTENISLEYPSVDSNVIAPGRHNTDMWKDETYDDHPDSWGDMQQLITFMHFLASNKSDGVTGKFLNVKDDWDKEEFIVKVKNDPNFLTLRRIDDFKYTAV